MPSSSKPLSYNEALIKHKNYQELVGTLYVSPRGNLYSVEEVMICPFDNLEKWIFINLYSRLPDEEQRTHLSEIDDFDVVLLVSENIDGHYKEYSIESPEILKRMMEV
jgi:hypothetical protein